MFKSISDFFVYLMNGKSQEELDKENVTTEVEEENSDVGLPLESDTESECEEELENVVVEEEKKGLLSFLRAEEKNEEEVEEEVEEEKNEEEKVEEEKVEEEETPMLKINEEDKDKFE